MPHPDRGRGCPLPAHWPSPGEHGTAAPGGTRQRNRRGGTQPGGQPAGGEHRSTCRHMKHDSPNL
eukprot:10483581-Alexandrium_andersonii.AAC.1